MKVFKVAIICGLTAIASGCAVVPGGYGYQSGYYARPVYYTQAVYVRPLIAKPFVVASWQHEHHHGYY